MSKLAVQVQYQEKTAELRKMVETEAKNLQDIIDAKESALLEVRTLGERKVLLNKTLLDLEKKTEETQEFLEQLIKKNANYSEQAKQDYDRDQEKIKGNKDLLSKIDSKLEYLFKVSSEVGSFIGRESDSREKYLVQRDKLDKAEAKFKEIEHKLDLERKEIEQGKRELDVTKKYLTELYGKVATYVKVMEETIELVNESLKNNEVPIHFNLPKNKVLEVDFDNFNKQ